jgi:hypothetical protein
MRVLVSNSISVPLIHFVSLLCFLWNNADPICLGHFLANVIIKMIVTVASLPFIYLSKKRIMDNENEKTNKSSLFLIPT